MRAVNPVAHEEAQEYAAVGNSGADKAETDASLESIFAVLTRSGRCWWLPGLDW